MDIGRWRMHGNECEEGQFSNNTMDSSGAISSECYHVIEITGQQWFWSFDCLELSTNICDTGTESMEVYGSVPTQPEEGRDLPGNNDFDRRHACAWFQHLGTKEDTLPGQQTTLWLPISDSMTDESMVLVRNTAVMLTPSWQPADYSQLRWIL